MNAIRRIQLQPPDHPPIEVSARAYRFYMVDVPGMLRWMSAQAGERGAIVRCDAMFLDAIRQQDGVMRVRRGEPANSREGDTVHARCLIAADGATSKLD